MFIRRVTHASIQLEKQR